MTQEFKQSIDIYNLISNIQSKGYILFEDKLNIIGIRSNNQIAGKFDDLLCVLRKVKGEWDLQVYSYTADPSDFYLKNPLSKLGCLILKPGQHIDKWCVGLHKGYPALVQCRDLVVVRDYNKDNKLDYLKPEGDLKLKKVINGYNIVYNYYQDDKLVYIEEQGIFGLNIHRASQYQVVPEIGLYSAGCQVVQYPANYKTFFSIVKEYEPLQNNRFSFTLLLESEYTSVKATPIRSITPNFVTPVVTGEQASSVEAKYGIRKTPYTL